MSSYLGRANVDYRHRSLANGVTARLNLRNSITTHSGQVEQQQHHSNMAVTRRSTRQTALTVPKYNVESSPSAEDKNTRRNIKKTTRRKRVRDEKDDNDEGREQQEQEKTVDESPPPAKKAATSKTKAKASKPTTPSTITNTTTTKHKASPPPAPSTESNRNPDGTQEVFWLLKAEPLPRYENGVDVSFSIDSLAACTAPEPWSGVRNPQARNNMQAMRVGDLGFFYHSNAKPSGVAGILRVVEEAKVDETAFDPKDPYYDAKSKREEPKWWCVGVEFVKKFDNVVSLEVLKREAAKGGVLKDMQVVHNSRLSVCRVRREEWEFVLGLAEGMGKEEEKTEEQKEEQR
ncbi:hypothetical protein IAQ61_007322 [Plenodomus lingam]|uniref:Thymocyte nuclear protein 1 n=1 Tax=Leptosphaeria maculans (strain JN3 / isolate v23.1.3 / race Av1-4-5-6-7-8) TaxID=985895 RepID=E5A0X0_LEPMJ|nr:hypothetical protein LEMA_P103970.1 [Plenodomus lingam JN3]KAH9868015.1 hypothetical protein IAQ61_007322 [Plenodomus lingam]CBX97266.1 hypothetical protein LEMA_P103970.1 [Plenodomus lingam JN3]